MEAREADVRVDAVALGSDPERGRKGALVVAFCVLQAVPPSLEACQVDGVDVLEPPVSARKLRMASRDLVLKGQRTLEVAQLRFEDLDFSANVNRSGRGRRSENSLVLHQ